MGVAVSEGGPQAKQSPPTFIGQLLAVLGLLVLFLFSLDLLAYSCKMVGADLLNGLVTATANPLSGLCIGLLATAMAQSSSLVTAMLVAIVATGQVAPAQVVPVIIGANIGTTITSNLVSFAYITKRKEFKRAFSAASCHHLFNVLTACIIFPLEYSTHFLSQLAAKSSEVLLHAGAHQVFALFAWVDTLHLLTQRVINGLGSSWGWVGIPFSILLLFASIQGFVYLVKTSLFHHIAQKIDHYVFGSPWRSLGFGVGITSLLQSSSLTTSAMVPLVARKQATLAQVFPFILGANIGTTVTALLASFAQGTGAALSIAVAHFLFNLIGVCIFFPIPVLRWLPIRLADWLGLWAGHRRLVALGYLLLVFFLLPFSLIFFAS
jgi:solute carrier family 34 (sodium-dependent phosphate cotransporter)